VLVDGVAARPLWPRACPAGGLCPLRPLPGLAQAGDRNRPEVRYVAGKAWAGGCRLRRAARLLVGPNKLRRPSDRIEGVVLALLAAAFLAVVAAAPVIGVGNYQWQRATAARLHPAVAVLSRNGPGDSGVAGGAQAAARWRAPDGQQRSGLLTTVTAPAIWDADAGTRVRVWLTSSGEPTTPPPSPAALMVSAVVITVTMACVAGGALFLCYWPCRLVLDRRRLAAWESAWTLTAPR
jgi:hypothetical protein